MEYLSLAKFTKILCISKNILQSYFLRSVRILVEDVDKLKFGNDNEMSSFHAWVLIGGISLHAINILFLFPQHDIYTLSVRLFFTFIMLTAGIQIIGQIRNHHSKFRLLRLRHIRN